MADHAPGGCAVSHLVPATLSRPDDLLARPYQQRDSGALAMVELAQPQCKSTTVRIGQK